MEEEKWITERLLKNKYEDLFKELNKDLYNILIMHKFNNPTALNKLKLNLNDTMNLYTSKMFKIY